VARATVDGSPIRDQVIARFHFAGTGRTGSPRQVTVRRKATALIVSWSAVAGAVRYGVIVNHSGGTQEPVHRQRSPSLTARRQVPVQRRRAGDRQRSRPPRRLGSRRA